MLTACKVPAIHDTFSQVIKHSGGFYFFLLRYFIHFCHYWKYLTNSVNIPCFICIIQAAACH